MADVDAEGEADSVALAEGLALSLGAGADSLADSDAEAVSLGSGAVSVGDAGTDSLADSETVALGEELSSVAKAVGAESSASGAMAAVAAATAMARRSFMKTSKVRCAAVQRHAILGEASACGARLWPLVRQV
ncbi:hypothetical protein AB0D57_01330 [Streptomyces sp. NPDC048275]|uniref:hypothetical protein n=1 Tax=Streptomyces sp. NPDC048275 TaxID=3155629 RepID=UPI0033E0572A